MPPKIPQKYIKEEMTNDSELAAALASYYPNLNRHIIKKVDSVNITSPNNVIISDMSFTPAQGKYLVNVFFSAFHNTNNATWNGSVYKDGVQISDTEYQLKRGGTQGNVPLSYFMMVEVDVDGTEQIDVRVRTNKGTLTVTGRIMVFIKIQE